MASHMPSGNYYYCHKCQSQKDSSADDFKCPTCNSGFIEKIENDHVEVVEERRNRPENELPVDEFIRSIRSRIESDARFDQIAREFASSSNRTSRSSRNGSSVQSTQSLIRNRYRQLRNSPNFGTGNTFGSNGPSRNLADEDDHPPFFRELLSFIISNGSPGNRIGGLSDEQISNLPTKVICEKNFDQNLQCAICLDNLMIGEEIFQLACEHSFHKCCIITWLKDKASCPVCRKNLLPNNATNDNNTFDARQAWNSFYRAIDEESLIFFHQLHEIETNLGPQLIPHFIRLHGPSRLFPEFTPPPRQESNPVFHENRYRSNNHSHPLDAGLQDYLSYRAQRTANLTRNASTASSTQPQNNQSSTSELSELRNILLDPYPHQYPEPAEIIIIDDDIDDNEDNN